MKRVLLLFATLTALSVSGFAQSSAKAPVKLVFWNISSVEVLREPYANAIAMYQAKNPSVQIESVPFEPNSYQQTKVPTAVAANELPDMMYFWGGSNVAPFVSKLVPLNSYIKDLQPRILGGMTAASTVNGQIYGLPTQAWVGTLYYNKALFAKYNVKPPVTYSDMLAAVKVFSAKGIPSWTASGQDAWTIGFYLASVVSKSAGVDKYRDASTGKISWNDPDIRRGLEFAQACIKAGAFDPSILALSRDESEVPFKTGKVAMYFHGSWLAPSLDSAAYGAVNFPYDEAAKANATIGHGFCNDFLYVSASAADKATAVDAVKFLAEEINLEGYQAGSTLPTYKFAKTPDTSKLSPLVKEVASLAGKWSSMTNGTAWEYPGISRSTAQRYFHLYQAFALNKMTVDQFIAESDKAAKLK